MRKSHPPTYSHLFSQTLFAKFLVLGFAVLLSACSSSGIKGLVEQPTIQVHKVQMGNFSLSGGSATFVLDIQNPNNFAIPLTGLDYGLRLNGVQVAEGSKAERVTIGAKQSQKLEIPLQFSFGNMLNMLPGLLRNRSVNYDLGGSIHLPWFKIPFNRAGSTNIQ
ncbi:MULTISPECIES: LEA type 2 family protein [Cocleimonas]|uniref:LEA14-like dessication related protein n=1 Tax=Cocleimonas flava TaxID=634765 RepID=A0A4R1EYU4_9GAMM|nr:MULTISPECIES: LEA type 2 family protein [Cocleimonas]MEB8432110.1 LEA type 2 family protein [Cocleimonas sp. KMM 6892]MEC4714804.1 LEA type 2 family protein [Cocleimonas sp. KMM 6895]MEC4744382.1 LEA type 2 family protein [Cocleimonas sp. KMM 6896]TCJ87027.1 LEA14-like dessication related protein [Cocleimonas flava]